MLRDFCQTLICGVESLFTLEIKGASHDSYGQDAEFSRHLYITVSLGLPFMLKSEETRKDVIPRGLTHWMVMGSIPGAKHIRFH